VVFSFFLVDLSIRKYAVGKLKRKNQDNATSWKCFCFVSVSFCSVSPVYFLQNDVGCLLIEVYHCSKIGVLRGSDVTK